jgi:hypothetical protein
MLAGRMMIQVMVSVSVLAILTILSLNSNKSSSGSMRLSGIMMHAKELAEQSKQFSLDYGRFATPADLGFATTDSQGRAANSFDDPSLISPYFIKSDTSESFVNMQDESGDWLPGQGPCGAVGSVNGQFNPQKAGVSDADILVFKCQMWNNLRNMVKTICSYHYGNAENKIWYTDQLIPGWVNEYIDSPEGIVENPKAKPYWDEKAKTFVPVKCR